MYISSENSASSDVKKVHRISCDDRFPDLLTTGEARGYSLLANVHVSIFLSYNFSAIYYTLTACKCTYFHTCVHPPT